MLPSVGSFGSFNRPSLGGGEDTTDSSCISSMSTESCSLNFLPLSRHVLHGEPGIVLTPMMCYDRWTVSMRNCLEASAVGPDDGGDVGGRSGVPYPGNMHQGTERSVALVSPPLLLCLLQVRRFGSDLIYGS